MIEDIKTMLGDRASNYTDAQINLAYKRATIEVESYCKRELDIELAMVCDEIAIIKLNRQGSEGVASQGYSGVSESYIDGYPEHIQKILDSKRRIRIL